MARITSIGGTTRQALTGWGRTTPARCDVSTPDSVAAIERHVSRSTTIARGRGRSYGDAAQNSGSHVLDTRRLDSIGPIDPTTGEVTVGAGTTLDQLMRRAIPEGWFVPVTPGTRQVTIGGAIAADIHGKNHHHDGTFCQHVTSMTIRTGRGIEALTPETTPTEFWATAGGMGLTGIIVDATIVLRPIDTAFIASRTERHQTLDGVMDGLRDADASSTYTVAWIDTLNPGRHLGRGIVIAGEHATIDQLESDKNKAAPLHFSPRNLRLPAAPVQVINPVVGKAFNHAWYAINPPGTRIETIGSFFHPLDAVENWNLLYGKNGFIQWQIVVPDAAGGFIAEALQQLESIGAGSFLSVLKRFGPANPGPLSFPVAGWTLAVDIPVKTPALAQTLNDLDRQTVSHGGRVYLAKDARLDPQLIGAMYPRLEEWHTIRSSMDPNEAFCSDLSSRLALTRPLAREESA